MPLRRLAVLIFRDGDLAALKELHANRPLFRLKESKQLLMAEYLVQLKHCRIAYEWCGQDCMVMEKAYDLTLAKFFNMPVECDDGTESTETEGPDCRYYYKAFYVYAIAKLRQKSSKNVVRAEYMSAELLQGMVKRHFYLSCLECSRQAQKLVKRYAWKLNGQTLYIWLPTEMPGRRCKTWLRGSVPDVDPAQPGERDRVQTIVNKLIAKRRIFSLDELERKGENVYLTSDPGPPMIERAISTDGLARSVAEEKADSIEHQRPAIQSLGKAKLRQLVGRVFDDLVGERYEAKGIAADFGLSKATFSRFAGSKWTRTQNEGTVTTVPDLWRNLAHVLASHRSFRRAAKEAGVWKRVCDVISTGIKREVV